MKKYIAVSAAAAVAAAALIIIPGAVIDSIPVAKSVTVQKIEHTDMLELTGSIVKNAATGEMTVLAYVPEKDISYVKEGQNAEITGEAFPGCIYGGTVSYISDCATSKQNGSAVKTVVEVKIDITDPDEKLKAGFTANTALKISDPETMMIVPYEAVDQDENGEYVFILDGNVPVKRYITTGKELSEGFEVISGITSEDCVITVDGPSVEGKTVILE